MVQRSVPKDTIDPGSIYEDLKGRGEKILPHCRESTHGIMRSSFKLALIALLSSVVYGFSSPTSVPKTAKEESSVLRVRRPSIMTLRGGARAANLKATPSSTGGSKYPATGLTTIAASIWGTGGVLYILGKAVKRVAPIAIEPFQEGAIPLSQFELGYVNMQR